MTEDQIKAIAWKLVEGNILPEITMPLIEDVIKQILKDYCIVESEKVMEEYKETCDEIAFETGNKSVLHQNVALGRKRLLESLFGTSMFNENEE